MVPATLELGMIDIASPIYENLPTAPTRPRMQYAPAPGPWANRPAVTIVTPYYNTGPIFHETARCVLGVDAIGTTAGAGQSLTNFEWIIVNDGSANAEALAVLQMYRELAQRDPRIRVLDHAKNHGLPATRNTGVRAARAPYIFFLDSDDLIEPSTIEKCALFLECNSAFGFVKGYTVGFGAQEYIWTKGFHDGAAFTVQNQVTATTMVRASVLREVGGFDESIRGGMEDWEFWLRCAGLGHWGGTIPEPLDWYRRRDRQHDSWENIANQEKRQAFLNTLKSRYPRIFAGEFPAPTREWHMPMAALSDRLMSPVSRSQMVSPHQKHAKRLLMIVPWLRMGGADRFNLDLTRYLTQQAGWEVTIATTLSGHPWMTEFAAITPDVFMLDHIANGPHIPRLLSHLIDSRAPDVVMITNSQHGYHLLPYLRSQHPEPAFVDFNHMEEPHWLNGGHPRSGAGMQAQLDLSIVVSDHLKRWMTDPKRGADPSRIDVCHINADTKTFAPDSEARSLWREDLKIDASTPVILYAARLCPQKQPPVFVRTIEKLARTTSDFVALVAGDGELFDQLREQVAAAGLGGSAPGDRVRILGTVPAAKMPSLMAAADIFFLPSQWEGIALSIYEAMAAELTVVGANVGGQAELVTPDAGILLNFPARDAELEASAYAGVLADLLQDPTRRRSLAIAARKRIQEHFELESMGRRMLASFDRAQQLHRDWPRQALDKPLAIELATLGIELVRSQQLAEYLWPYRDRYFAVSKELPTAEDRARSEEARRELEHIQNSASFRFIQKLKRVPPWSIYIKARYGQSRASRP